MTSVSARYVLVLRGVLLLIVLESIVAALIFAVSVPRVLRFGSELALPAGLFVGVGFVEYPKKAVADEPPPAKLFQA